ncbi:MAG: homocysteine biosynthesis protein [Synechococcaceae cyanobacterium]|nr:homocysteine biosynthesis protein [Synechococcaceae cyanobacterium]
MSAAARLPRRDEAELRRRQRRGDLRVRTAAEYRRLVREQGLEAAYRATDVVVAADAEFTDQASLHLALGPTDPPIRLRDARVGGVPAQAAGGGGDLVLPVGAGGGRVLAELLAGRSVEVSAAGEATPLQPRRDLHTRLSLARIGSGRLLLHRGIRENGVVAVSSAEGVLRTPYGPLLGPWGNALYSCGGAGSIGLAMPGLTLLGPGSPVLVGGALGWVVGSGSAHQPRPRRLPGGHARTPGAEVAVCVDLHGLRPEWVRPARFEGQGSALLVAIAAPIPLISPVVARRAAAGDDELEAPVLDLAIPRRVRPSPGTVSYAALRSGRIEVGGQRLRAAPAHSPRLAAAIAAELIERLRAGRFPLRLPLRPLARRVALVPLDD